MSTGNGTVPTADEVEALRQAIFAFDKPMSEMREAEAQARYAYWTARNALEASTV
jgi:hypothetical protein